MALDTATWGIHRDLRVKEIGRPQSAGAALPHSDLTTVILLEEVR